MNSADDNEEIPELVQVGSTKVIPVTILTGFLGSGAYVFEFYLFRSDEDTVLFIP